MTDALDVLYDEIEKARGLIPKGGSARLSAKFKNQSRKLARGARADMAAFDNSRSKLTNSNQKRLDRGYKRAGRAGDLSAARAYLTRRQVRKSDTDSLDRLYEAVEKARGLIPSGKKGALARLGRGFDTSGAKRAGKLMARISRAAAKKAPKKK